MIDNMNVPIGGASQTISTPATKEVVAHAACGGTWINRTPRQVSHTGVDRSTTGNVFNAVFVKHATSPVLIISVTTSPPCVLSGSLQIAEKRQSISPDLGENTKNLDAVVDENFPIIWILRQFSARQSVTNSLTFPAMTFTCTVG